MCASRSRTSRTSGSTAPPFDYIHGRCILPSLRDLPTLMRRIYENLQPGGYVEFMEMLMVIEAIDDTLANTVLPRWHWLITEGVRRIGREPMLALHTRQLLQDAGFVNIVEKKFAVPINPWARGDEQKVRGALMLANLLDACESITMTVCRLVWGWSLEQVEALLVDIRASLKNRNIHAYVPLYVLWALQSRLPLIDIVLLFTPRNQKNRSLRLHRYDFG